MKVNKSITFVYPENLLDPETSLIPYRSILKTLLNNKNIPWIAPLLQQHKFIIDFKEKAEMFNF